MYTIDDLERDLAKRDKILKEIRADRGKRYGSPDDTLGNVAAFGWIGAVVSHYECACRLRNAVNKLIAGKGIDVDDIKDACRDASNYAAYVEILLERNELCPGEQ